MPGLASVHMSNKILAEPSKNLFFRHHAERIRIQSGAICAHGALTWSSPLDEYDKTCKRCTPTARSSATISTADPLSTFKSSSGALACNVVVDVISTSSLCEHPALRSG